MNEGPDLLIALYNIIADIIVKNLLIISRLIAVMSHISLKKNKFVASRLGLFFVTRSARKKANFLAFFGTKKLVETNAFRKGF